MTDHRGDATQGSSALHNAHLEGGPFFWEAGPIGVLLCHGLTATTAEVRPLARRLHVAGYTVTGPLLPGHGTTPEDLNRVRWQDWAGVAEAAYQKLIAHCQRAFLGGESMGAVLALYLASQHATAGVLTCAPAIKLNFPLWDRIRLHLLAPLIPWQTQTDWCPAAGWQGYPVMPLRAVIQLRRMQREVVRRLSHLQQPVLIFQGRVDDAIHPESGRIIRQGVSSPGMGSKPTEVHWMEESAHTVILDREFEQVVALTLDFMERAQSTTTENQPSG